MSKIESPGFGCGAGSPVLPPEKCAVVETANGVVRLENVPPHQLELWKNRGDNYAVIGRLADGTPVLVYLSDLAQSDWII